ncbi:MAG: NYN domain-containing protein [Methanomassiliicoccaceae archaeon]|nr:NYN domain-containing protein [Methanomassiliicoccaceae archaeon]
MIKNQETDRVMVFIDHRNVANSQYDTTGMSAELDYWAMVQALVGNRHFAGAYVFDGAGGERGARLHDALRRCGFRVLIRDVIEHEDGIQKEVDVDMACEILSHAIKDHYDTAIIVSGDRDFRPVVERLHSEGKKAEVAGFDKCMSSALRRSGDCCHSLDVIPMVRFTSEYRDPEPKGAAPEMGKVMGDA